MTVPEPNPTPRLRRAGGWWRLLVHEYRGGHPRYGRSHHVTNDPAMHSTRGQPRHLGDGPYSSLHTLPASTEFDELVVGRWLHVEQMDTGRWWMNVGGVTLWVDADRDGRPKNVTVYAPGDYADPVPGCTYGGAVGT